MTKRGLCMLLAVVSLFSLTIPAFAEGEPAEATEEPVVIEAPVEVTEEPAEATEEPVEVTEGPVEVTEEPVEATEEPVETTEAPVAAAEEPVEVPEIAEAPKQIEAPKPSPSPTAAPSPTLAPTLAAKLAMPKLGEVSNEADGVKITWGKVSGAAKYRVLYMGGGRTSWTKLADTTSTSYTWTRAKSGTEYAFTVRCISEDGKNYTSGYNRTGKSVTYVAAPTVTISNAVSGVKVTWTKVKGAARYAVYYKVGNGGWHKIGTTTKTAYTWKKAASGKTYTFAVRCMDARKNLLSAFKASNTLKYVAAPVVKIARATDGIKVTWNRVAGASKYTVYYKEGSGDWKKIGTTDKTSYTWTRAQNGKTYVFTVRCTDADKNLLSAFKASESLKYTTLPENGDRDAGALD